VDSELEALLRGEGRLDSSGTFTLDASKAKVKLGRFHLPPGLWVASLVQAGVAAGCERIDVTCKDILLGRGTRLIYSGLPPRAFNLDAIMKGLEEPLSLGSGTPEAYLTEGILASGTAPAWVRVGKAGREVLRQRGEAVECWRSGDAGPERAVLDLDASLPTPVVRSRCQFSPVPVWVGGDRLSPRWDNPLEVAIFHVAVKYCRTPAPPLALPALRKPMVRVGTTGPVATSPLEEGVFLEVVEGEGPWNLGLLLPADLPRYSTVQWVRDGVVIETVENVSLGSMVGCRIVASSEGLATDLTRFHLVKDDRYRERLNEFAEQIRQLFQELKRHETILRVPDHSFGAADTAVSAMAISAAGLLGLALAGVASWPVSVLGMCLASPLAGYLAFRQRRGQLDQVTTQRVKGALWPGGERNRQDQA